MQQFPLRIHKKSTVFQNTAPITNFMKNQTAICRDLLGSRPQSNLITTQFVQRLQLPSKKRSHRIHSLGSKAELPEKRTFEFLVNPEISPAIPVHGYVLGKLVNPLHSKTRFTKFSEQILELQHADSTFNTPSTIDIIFGAKHFTTL